MRYFIALRLVRKLDGFKGLENIGALVIDSNQESKDPAFRNLLQGLEIPETTNGTSVFWYLIEDGKHSIEELYAYNETEAIFTQEWLEEEKDKVRYFRGIDYCDATEALAKKVTLKDPHREIEYEVKRSAA